MTGFDKSAGMVELARRRLGDDADLLVAELGGPLPFPDRIADRRRFLCFLCFVLQAG